MFTSIPSMIIDDNDIERAIQAKLVGVTLSADFKLERPC